MSLPQKGNRDRSPPTHHHSFVATNSGRLTGNHRYWHWIDRVSAPGLGKKAPLRDCLKTEPVGPKKEPRSRLRGTLKPAGNRAFAIEGAPTATQHALTSPRLQSLPVKDRGSLRLPIKAYRATNASHDQASVPSTSGKPI